MFLISKININSDLGTKISNDDLYRNKRIAWSEGYYSNTGFYANRISYITWDDATGRLLVVIDGTSQIYISPS